MPPIRKESGGRLGFKIYAGGVQGEDKDVMRKIRLGQLHSAGITGVGSRRNLPQAAHPGCAVPVPEL